MYWKKEKKWAVRKEIKIVGKEMFLLEHGSSEERTLRPDSQHSGWLWKEEILVLSL